VGVDEVSIAGRTTRSVLKAAGRSRRLGPRRGGPTPVWREPVDGRAPRLGPREFIGADITRKGPWADRDPLVTPRWWSRYEWVALAGWAALTGGAGYLAWRKHGGKAALFGDPLE